MQIKTQDTLNRITSVQAFLEGDWKVQWANVPYVATLAQQLASQKTAIESLAQSQEVHGGQGSGYVVKLSGLREALLHDLEDMHRDAVILSLEDPSIAKLFEMPRSGGDQAILSAARTFKANALPIESEFLKLGMPADFLADLENDILAFEALLGDRDAAKQASAGALRELTDALAASSKTIDTLDAIFRKVLNPTTLAEWLRAKRFDAIRAHRKSASKA